MYKHIKNYSILKLFLDSEELCLLHYYSSLYLMINELKENYLKLKMKIKKLEIENDDFKLCLDNLNSLFIEYNNEAKFQEINQN
ncbi:hypothetical protein H8356DRAFT_1339794 [Neocallimastix lanati (nom. inval.)]|nr:hypothetical protein H8356DRAFT_1339794 [Neocallimastix sp. JGI-2020a]